MYYLNLACKVQLSAQATGARQAVPPPEICETAACQYDETLNGDGDLMLEWQAHLRMLDGIDPSYKT